MEYGSDLYWLDGWGKRIDAWLVKYPLPISHAEMLYLPDRLAEAALILFSVQFPVPVTKIQSELEIVKNRHHTAKKLESEDSIERLAESAGRLRESIKVAVAVIQESLPNDAPEKNSSLLIRHAPKADGGLPNRGDRFLTQESTSSLGEQAQTAGEALRQQYTDDEWLEISEVIRQKFSKFAEYWNSSKIQELERQEKAEWESLGFEYPSDLDQMVHVLRVIEREPESISNMGEIYDEAKAFVEREKIRARIRVEESSTAKPQPELQETSQLEHCVTESGQNAPDVKNKSTGRQLIGEFSEDDMKLLCYEILDHSSKLRSKEVTFIELAMKYRETKPQAENMIKRAKDHFRKQDWPSPRNKDYQL